MENDRINLADYVGSFLPLHVRNNFYSLDGACVAEWLRTNGHSVEGNRDTGRNGEAWTADGYSVSTNGYVSRR